MNAFPWVLNGLIEARVSAIRVANFLIGGDETSLALISFAEREGTDVPCDDCSILTKILTIDTASLILLSDGHQ
jgi:hypothetical protein